jgi:hypothetical protein
MTKKHNPFIFSVRKYLKSALFEVFFNTLISIQDLSRFEYFKLTLDFVVICFVKRLSCRSEGKILKIYKIICICKGLFIDFSLNFVSDLVNGFIYFFCFFFILIIVQIVKCFINMLFKIKKTNFSDLNF